MCRLYFDLVKPKMLNCNYYKIYLKNHDQPPGDNVASIMEVDHDGKQVFQETIRVLPTSADSTVMRPSEDAVAARLTSPACTTYIDTDRISFERLASLFFKS